MNRILIFLQLVCLTFAINAQDKSENFERKNLGEKINSKYMEMTPKISADGKVMYFVRAGHPKNKNPQDIWFSTKGEDGHWTEAKIADKTLNRIDANCVWSVNADGFLVLIRGAFKDGVFIGRGFSLTRLTEKGWTDPEMLVIDELESMDHGDNDGISLALDGSALIITMSEKTNSKNYDLYVSRRKGDNTFAKPVKIGSKVNSEFAEFAPYMASDNRTLFFSSDRPGGIGLSDIYKAERLDTGWTNWGDPLNVGAPVNTPEKDGYYVTDAKGDYGYMVSELNSIGKADIDKIKINSAQKGRPVVLMDGKIYNAKTKKPIAATVEYYVYPDDGDEGIAHTDHVSGNYKVVLPYGDNYAINVLSKGYVPYYDTISLPASGEFRELRRDYYMVPLEVGQKVVLKNIYFETAKYDLLPSSFYQLNKVLELMNADMKLEIEIGGHTDDVGLNEDNRILSQERAIAVMNYLVSKGIELNRMRAVGYGEDKPLAANDSDANRQSNRRVEFTITKK